MRYANLKLVGLFVLGAAVLVFGGVVAAEQTDAPGDTYDQGMLAGGQGPGAPGGMQPGMPGPPGRNPGMGGPGMGMGPMAMAPPAIAVDGGFVYVVQGGTLYKFSADTLDMVARNDFAPMMMPMMGPGMMGPGMGPGPQPGMGPMGGPGGQPMAPMGGPGAGQ